MVSLPLHSVVERNLHLQGNLMGGHCEALKVIDYIKSGQITPLVDKIELECVPEYMQRMVDCETIGKGVVCL